MLSFYLGLVLYAFPGEPGVLSVPLVDGRPGDSALWEAAAVLEDEATGTPFCSAVLIGREKAVTAAHCVQGLSELRGANPIGVSVRFAAVDAVQLCEVDLHPDYVAGEFSDDIAVLHLCTRPELQAGALPDTAPRLEVGQSVTLVAYGSSQESAREALGSLQVGTASVVEVGLDEAFIEGAPTRACGGDSGGGVYIRSSEAFQLVGLIGSGPRNCSGRTRVHLLGDAQTAFIEGALPDSAVASETGCSHSRGGLARTYTLLGLVICLGLVRRRPQSSLAGD